MTTSNTVPEPDEEDSPDVDVTLPDVSGLAVQFLERSQLDPEAKPIQFYFE